LLLRGPCSAAAPCLAHAGLSPWFFVPVRVKEKIRHGERERGGILDFFTGQTHMSGLLNGKTRRKANGMAWETKK
jgi:hypothetical protein